MFYWEFSKNFQNSFSTEHMRTAASGYFFFLCVYESPPSGENGVREAVLKIFGKFPVKHPWFSPFSEGLRIKSFSFTKIGLRRGCFLVNFSKKFGLYFLQNSSGRMLLNNKIELIVF